MDRPELAPHVNQYRPLSPPLFADSAFIPRPPPLRPQLHREHVPDLPLAPVRSDMIRWSRAPQGHTLDAVRSY